jgi:hypothetical protein
LELKRPIRNGMRDYGYHEGEVIMDAGQLPVADLSFELLVERTRKEGTLAIEIYDPWQDATVGVRFDWALNTATLFRDSLVLGTTTLGSAAQGPCTIRFEHVDDQLFLCLDGSLVLERTFFSLPQEPAPGAQTRLRLRAQGGDAKITPVALYRDIHYLPGLRNRYIVPEHMGFFLGDHVNSSADSRQWGRVAIEVLETGAILFGDKAGTTSQSLILNPSNPWQRVDGSWAFCDIHGDFHVFENEQGFRKVGGWPTPFASLDTLNGRAMAVVWPPSRWKWLR